MFAPIAGTTGVASFDVAGKTGSAASGIKASDSGTSELDKQAFAALMDPEHVASGSQSMQVQHGSAALSGLEKFAIMQKTQMQNNMQSMRDLAGVMPYMSMAESAGFGMELQLNLTVTKAQFDVATNAGKSTGKSIDTLMRNQ